MKGFHFSVGSFEIYLKQTLQIKINDFAFKFI